MRVAIDVGPLTSGDKVRGVGFYTKHLIDALEKEIAISKELTLTKLNSEEILKGAAKYDVIHVPYFNPFFNTVPEINIKKLVITIHDVIPLLYPDKYPPGIKGKYRFNRQKRILKKVGAIITDSEASKKDIVRFLNVPQDKVYPIYLAPANNLRKVTKSKLSEIRNKYKLPRKYVLYVGDLNYNKNILTLIEACELSNIPLVIVGKSGKDLENYKSEIHHLAGPRDWARFLFGKPHPEITHYAKICNMVIGNNNVLRLGFVPDIDMASIYKGASVYVQPSFAEGFGLPVLEAMSCGTPTVISKTQCLVEIAGGKAIVADPNSSKDFSDKITRIIKSKSLSQKLSKDGIKYVNNFSWKKTALETIKVYEKLL